jgi:hypothetical protein
MSQPLALEGRNLNSLAFQRQVGIPRPPTRPEGAVLFSVAFRRATRWVPPLQGGVGLGGLANLALKRQAIQIPPFQGGTRRVRYDGRVFEVHYVIACWAGDHPAGQSGL